MDRLLEVRQCLNEGIDVGDTHTQSRTETTMRVLVANKFLGTLL